MIEKHLTPGEYIKNHQLILDGCWVKGEVPASVKRLATRFGIKLKYHYKLTESEAKELYLALTGFNHGFFELIQEMDQNNIISLVRTCFLVNNGVWSKSEMEMIIRSSSYPASILEGEKEVESYLIYKQCINDVTGPLITSIFERKLETKAHISKSGVSFDLEDEKSIITSTYLDSYYGKVYISEDRIILPWVQDSYFSSYTIEKNTGFYILVRPRLPFEANLYFPNDLEDAIELKKNLESNNLKQSVVAILVSSDFTDAPLAELYFKISAEHNIPIIVCPETLADIQVMAKEKLERSYLIRHE